MLETLLAVIVGGAIGIIASLIPVFVNERRLKRETMIQHLRLKREKLEKVYKNASDKILDGITKNSFSSDMLSDVVFLFP